MSERTVGIALTAAIESYPLKGGQPPKHGTSWHPSAKNSLAFGTAARSCDRFFKFATYKKEEVKRIFYGDARIFF